MRNVWITLLALGGSLALATGAQAEDKAQRIKKLQRANRVYQVCVGRSLKPSESAEVAQAELQSLVQKVCTSAEAKSIFADRLATFAEGGETKERPPITARTEQKLEDVLKVLGGAHHKGKLCGQTESNSSCFAKWLVARVAPTLGEGWVTERQNVLNGWTYARLLEEISASSLKEE